MTRKQHKRRPLEERFWEKVDASGECWLWLGCTTPLGYGRITRGAAVDGSEYAHRVAWSLANGLIPEKKQVLHRCDTRSCCNPEHLYLGTPADNMRDRDMRGRNGQTNKTHCKHGHAFSKENTYYFPTRQYGMRRVCKECCRQRRLNKRATESTG